ncbi:MAG: N-acetylmuramoyl-L-alanine amidase [Firmicutes bacterium]|nr:N-acetylmuramoyl-L-alanine amidase [Bacillota bacterium]
MRRYAWRQAAIAGLALLLMAAVVRTAWTGARTVMVDAQLKDAGRWLRGRVLVLDPGHGGDDPGAVVRGTLEKHLVLEIGLTLKRLLEEQGATVVMTRDEDVDLGGPIREELGRRVALVGQHGAHVYVSIHANKDGCNCWGAQTFYQKDGMPAGQELALAIQNRLRKLTPTTRVALPANYFVLRTSPVAAAMVEVGFLTNAHEQGQLKDPAYQRTLATAMALGLADFFRSQVPEGRAEGGIGR